MTRSMTLDDFLAAEKRRSPAITPDVIALLHDLSSAARAIADVAATGARADRLEAVATRILLNRVEDGGYLAALSLDGERTPHPLPVGVTRGTLRLALKPIDGAAGIELGIAAGTLFSLRRTPGAEQLCGGYVLYGPTTLLVITLGAGTHGFTLDGASGDFVSSRPAMRVPEGPLDPEVRWSGCVVADVHRVLLRGGVYVAALDLLHEAAPLAMLVEQAGGAVAKSGDRALLGSPDTVARLLQSYEAQDRGQPFRSPLFGTRSLFSER